MQTLSKILSSVALICLIPATNQAFAQSVESTVVLSFADYADLAVNAPLAIRAQVRKVTAIPPQAVQTVPAGYRRMYVQARVLGLIRGEAGIGRDISYLYDVPLDARGKPKKITKKTVLLFARTNTVRPDQIQLVARDAQVDWTAEGEAMVRSVIAQALANNAPPRISGVGDAFHVPGTIAGESETQIFLKTQSGEPVSLSIIRRPGEQPRWAVALGEIVDESATAPRRDTLLWYNLACFLPSNLPAPSIGTLSPVDASAARADYQVVLAGLGRCSRTRR